MNLLCSKYQLEYFIKRPSLIRKTDVTDVKIDQWKTQVYNRRGICKLKQWKHFVKMYILVILI